MNKSLYAAVTGIRTHQTRMDVIGNNIANVNTYGFKSSRATFRDVYYQTVSGARAGSGTVGGNNPSSVGYGAQQGSIDLLMGQSSFTMTDNSMDLAIDGEGFLQVQDADGNRFYTRSGQMNFDSAGNLVDAMGNFVLGINGNPLGQTGVGDSIISISLPSVNSSAASGTVDINGRTITVTATNATEKGNISMQIISGSGMIDGLLAEAKVGTSGIVVTINEKETFPTIGDLNAAINDAVEKAMLESSGTAHPAGNFTVTVEPLSAWPQGGLTGAEICSTDYGTQYGKATAWPSISIAGGFKPTGVTGITFGSDWGGANPGVLDGFTATPTVDGNGAVTQYEIELTISGKAYKGVVEASKTEPGTMKLVSDSDSSDFIVMQRPNFNGIDSAVRSQNELSSTDPITNEVWDIADGSIKPPVVLTDTTFSVASASKALGFSSSKINLTGGTEGGPQSLESLTGIAVGSDGLIVASHDLLGDIVIGQLQLATFANPSGLLQAGNNYFTPSANSGQISYTAPGVDGSGQVVAGALELSNVDLSREFADMITTQRGYQACARLVTVSDDMLEELVNLKR